MRYKIILTVYLFLLCSICSSQTILEQYRVSFLDKKESIYTVDEPELFLSHRSLQRREKYAIEVTREDIPICETYLDSLKSLGAAIYSKSKWLNSAVVGVEDDSIIPLILRFSFVDTIVKVAPRRKNKPGNRLELDRSLLGSGFNHDVGLRYDKIFYGNTYDETTFVNGQYLHESGYFGDNVLLAILDAGFNNTDSIALFDRAWATNRIVAYKDFVKDSVSIFASNAHGTSVFSQIGSYFPGTMVGAAPNANYVLLRTEDENTEYIVEEENWISGVEYADSLGVDLIVASLGYSLFEDSTQNHTYAQLDGKTTRISQAADIATEKGIVLVESAGNYGNKVWKYIAAPADAFNVLSVGAVSTDSTITAFSSRGNSADGRIKPDIVAKGMGVSVVNGKGLVVDGTGTSFAAPVIAGFAACLLQAFPDATPLEIKYAITRSAHKYFSADSIYGYGIPDFRKAYSLLNDRDENVYYLEKELLVYPNPFDSTLIFEIYNTENDVISVEIIDKAGRLLYTEKFKSDNYLQSYTIDIGFLMHGVYIFKVTKKDRVYLEKVVKMN